MDGPNINWKFYSVIKEKLSTDFDAMLINICSCGLHVLHNNFKAGATASGWVVSSILASLYQLFKDAPAQREYYHMQLSMKLPISTHQMQALFFPACCKPPATFSRSLSN